MPIRYACVYDGLNMISEYPIGEQPVIATTLKTVLASVPGQEYRRQSIVDKDMKYHYLSNGESKIVACAATADVEARVIFAFLDSVESQVRGQRAELRNVKKMLSDAMTFHNDPANDKAGAIKSKLETIQGKVTDDIELALGRGAKITEMHQTSIDLVKQGATFNDRATTLKREMLLRHLKMVLMVGGAVVVVVVILLMIVCKPNFSDCRS